MDRATKDIPVGYQLPPVTKVMSQERMSVYSDMEEANVRGRMELAPTNIHKDPEFARAQGLPGTIADGLISTAWTEAVLRDFFGEGYLQGGRLMTKFIKPVFAGDILTLKATVTERTPEGEALRLVLEFAWENQRGEPVTVGTASGLVR
ncbi:MAG: MaoC family dehydratase [Dehalococcoidia bacterium]